MPEGRLWWATLASHSPRYATWREIFGTDRVPLKAPGTIQAKLGGELAEVYELAVDQLTAEQRYRLVDELAFRFQEAPSVVDGSLDAEGVPIRAADVVVAFSLRAFL